MKNRILSLFTVLMLIATMFTTNVFATATPITLDTIADTYVGNPILIKGTVNDASITAIIIRILRPDGAMFAHKNITLDEFKTGYNLPTSSKLTVTPIGQYKIEVGYGEDVALKATGTFNIIQKKSGGSSTNHDNSGYYNPTTSTTPTTAPTTSTTPTTTPSTTESPVPTVAPTETPAPTNGSAPTGADSFKDLADHDWAKEAVDSLVKDGIVNGTSSTTYEPDRHITRAEFCKLVVSAFELKDEENAEDFTDVQSGAWYNSFVKIASKTGVVTGVGENKFDPDASITREEMAAMIVRAFKASGIEIPSSDVTFTDADEIGSWASQYVAGLAKMGIIGGRGDNKFVPKDSLTRAESAKVIYSSLNFLKQLKAN